MSTDKNERASSQVMELNELIAGPLVATIDADALSAQRYMECLYRIAFDSYDPLTGKTGALRMLTFSYRSRDLNGSRMQSVRIPVLTLVPLPLLQIQEADFDFDIRVLDASSRRQRSTFSFATGRGGAESDASGGCDTRLRVALAATGGGRSEWSEHRQGSLNANMKVHVKMRQADLPGGLSLLLSKAVNNMAEDVTLPSGGGPETEPDAPAGDTPAVPAGGDSDNPKT